MAEQGQHARVHQAGLQDVRGGQQREAARAGSAQIAQPGVIALCQLHQDWQPSPVRQLQAQTCII